MMRLLLIDTCGSEGSIALAEGGGPKVVASERLPGRSASERLLPVVREAMQAAGWGLGDLAAIGVVNGPGSFTGVRVGLSAAKGLSEAAGVPLVAVSRLALLAASVSVLAGESRVCAVLDAGRGEYYCGVYEGGRMVSEALVAGAEVADVAEGAVLVACEARVEEVLGARLVSEPGAVEALPLVAARVTSGEFDDAAAVDANYLRRTDLEIFVKNAALEAAKGAGQ